MDDCLVFLRFDIKIKILNLEKGSEIFFNFNNIFKKKSFKI